jgi:hypothetical protein
MLLRELYRVVILPGVKELRPPFLTLLSEDPDMRGIMETRDLRVLVAAVVLVLLFLLVALLPALLWLEVSVNGIMGASRRLVEIVLRLVLTMVALYDDYV